MFSKIEVKRQQKTIEKKEVKKEKKEIAKLLDEKRSREVGIFISSQHISIDIVEKGL